jgi:proteasomal ATPase-associated factor 1
LDVSEGGLGISVCQNNQIRIWETESGNVRVSKIDETIGLVRSDLRISMSFFQRTLEGHVGDVYSCRLFPSGVVALTAGADMRLKIWSAETGQSPVTLIGHTAAIQDTCIVDRGRNVISVSK